MSIVILGAGELGSYMAKALSDQNKHVILIDRDENALDKFTQKIDLATIKGLGTRTKNLQLALEDKAVLFIAVSGSDETNLVACTIAKKMGYPKTIARIRDISYLDTKDIDLKEIFDIDYFISPEIIVAHDLFRNVIHSGSIKSEGFGHGALQMRTITIPEKWKESSMKVQDFPFEGEACIGFILRKTEPEEQFLFPEPNQTILPKDEVTFFAKTDKIEEVLTFFDIGNISVKSAVIVGGSDIAIHLAKILEDQKISVKIIEHREERCQILSRELPSATVLQHDEADMNFLIEEKISRSDVFIACSSSTEKNILAASLAQDSGCRDVIALVSDTTYDHMLQRLNIPYIVSEKISMTNRVLSIISGDSLVSMTTIYEERVKVILFKVSKNSKMIGKAQKDIPFKETAHLIVIFNKEQVEFVHEHTLIEEGDHLLVLCAPIDVEPTMQMF